MKNCCDRRALPLFSKTGGCWK